MTLSWREGSRGPERAKFRALRGWRVDPEGTTHIGRLIGQRPARGQTRGAPKWKYFWSNFGPEVALDRRVEYAHRRHGIEQFYEEAKGLLGWDQFQGRRYDAFHRHTVAVMLSYSFLVWLEYRARLTTRRRGRRRRAFSPRLDRRRRTLPRVHRAVADWLLQAALRTVSRTLSPLRSYPLLL